MPIGILTASKINASIAMGSFLRRVEIGRPLGRVNMADPTGQL